MKLDSSLNYYNRLIDKSLNLNERLKLAVSLWDLDDSTHVQANKQQLIVDWIIDLLINRRRYSFTEEDFNCVLERLNHFLNNAKFKNTPINGGLPFVQVLFEAFNSDNESLKETVHECCFKLFKTKFSHYFTRNIDQMTKMVTYFVVDLNNQLSVKKSDQAIEQGMHRAYLVLQKYFLCLKSQQNQNRLFNRLCTQILFHLLNLIENLKSSDNEVASDMSGLVWKILKYGLFSKSHANIYNDFFKNLPASFSAKSNYQVAALFNTIQSEASKSLLNLQSICHIAHLIIREVYAIMQCTDYRQNQLTIQFIIDLIWALKTDSSPQEATDLIIESMSNLTQIIDDLNLFNKVDDLGNQNLFKNWSKNLINQTFKCQFNGLYVEFLIRFLNIDHCILDTNLELIIKKIKVEDNLTRFLSIYFDCNVKFRQLSRATHMLLDVIKTNKDLHIPIAFHEFYATSLENYNVDSQTLVQLWRDFNKLLSECSDDATNARIEYVKFLNSLLSRVNLTNQRLPSHLKTQALEYLDESQILLSDYLTLKVEFNDKNDVLIYYLDCFYTCGLVYLILYRYSMTSSSHLTAATASTAVLHSNACRDDLTNFLTILNDTFDLNTKISEHTKVASNFKMLFYLNKLDLLNVFAFNLKPNTNDSSVCLTSLASKLNMCQTGTPNLKFIKNFNIDSAISNSNDYSAVLVKYLIIDNFYLIAPLIRGREVLMQQYLKGIFQLILTCDSDQVVIDKINLDAIFNDSTLVKYVMHAVLSLLGENSDDDSKVNKFLEKLIELVASNGDEEIRNTLFESKKYNKITLNDKQSKIIFRLSTYLPLDFIDTNHALIVFFLNEKICDKQPNKLTTYIRLFATMNLLEIMPLNKAKAWLSDILSFFKTDNNAKLYQTLFDKLVKKCVRKLLIDETFECLQSFVDNLIKSLQVDGEIESLNYMSFGHLTLIQILENISKIQEFTLTLNRTETKTTKLNEIFNQILDYFIATTSQIDTANSQMLSEYLVEFQESHLFYICLILMRRICSSIESINQANAKQFEYFKSLFKTCSKTHKEKMNSLLHSDEETMDTGVAVERQLKVNSFHIDFIKSSIYYSEKLASKDDSLKTKPIKGCKSLVDLLLRIDNTFQFDVSYYTKLAVNSIHNLQEDAESSNQESLKYILIKSIAMSLNTLKVEESLFIMEHFVDKSKASTQCLKKLFEFVSYATRDIELNESLKISFSELTQKLLIQLQPIYISLKRNNQLEDIIDLLKLQTRIVSSKYFLFPSHLVISTLQTFVSLDFNQFPIGTYVTFQELACKTMNNILVRYSRKFSKISAIICGLLTRLIGKTTSLANQSSLDDDTLVLAIKAAQDLERIITQLAGFKKEFYKIAPYMLSEYACIANTIPMHPSVKNILASAMYNLISICDIYGISQLHVALPIGPRELFKTIYAEYEKYFKYTGKT